MLRFRLVICATLAGCGAPVPTPPDAAPPAQDVARPSCELRFVPADPLRVRTRDRVALSVRVTPPAAGTEVRFALVGDALDSSLSETRRTVNAAGVAGSELTAPSTAGSFRVRAAAGCSADAYLDVSVGDRGFGSLAIEALYRGARLPTRLSVGLYRANDCVSLTTMGPDRSAIAPLPGAAVSFGELPAGVDYVVRGLALGRNDVELAVACAGPTRVEAGAVARTSLVFTDAPLRLGVGYELAMSFDLAAVATVSAARWLAPVSRDLARAGGSAGAVGAELAAAVAAAALPAERDRDRAAFEAAYRDRLAAAVNLQLTRRETQIEPLFERIAAATGAVASAARSAARATAAPDEQERFVVSGARYVLDPETPDVEGDDVEVPAPAEARLRVTAGLRDAFAVDLEGYPLPWNVLTRAALGAWLRRQGVSSSSEHVALSVCPVVVPIVRGAAGRCDDACVTAACRRAVASLGALFDAAVTTLDPPRMLVDLRWNATPQIPNGTLVVDRLTGVAAGGFREDGATAVAASTQLARVAAP